MIKSIFTKKSIVLYWDLPDSFVLGDYYEVFCDGKHIGKTEKCHFETDAPKSGQQSLFRVIKKSGNDEEAVGEVTCTMPDTKRRIDVSKPPYNAKGDGKTLNTERLQKAINDCTIGECVYIPEGDYMTGALMLHSDMELYLDKGAILHGTDCVSDYEPKIKSRFEGIEMMCYAALLNIGRINDGGDYECKNVTISGEGTVCGGGISLAKNVIAKEKVLLKSYLESLGDKIKECETEETIPGRARPRLINVSCAQNVVISGITIMNGACWNVHMIYSNNIVTYGCTFRSQGVWNGDGWDPDSSSDCTIFNCDFYTGDDAVAIKSGKNPEGNVKNIPCRRIRIFDCVSHFGHGITIGSEMSGGVKDVRIWNCDMKNSVYGVEIKGTKKRGGYVRDVVVKNSVFSRLLIHSVSYNDDGEAAPEMPVFEDCRFENLQLTGKNMLNENENCKAIELSGFDSPGHFLKNIRIKNVTIDSGNGNEQTISLQCCEGVTLENISCR